ncbi:hypothetical protein AYM40_27670 [Paraburkholderia phytofirmans OLGA172]|uniref:DUF302 domain-containing protein n=1 Tax=Paraburkholderia phytofirmans OLGA172 TaxID=1417228 RepID=A0A160FSJ3_9BURK|nr:DUF302 domain-containing protein [Paraburkholderia phytofirmans]ANB76060.1 hypothetical protein AYM40_27670 [Paraburkholderia phytofirmans OLGA172]
MSPLRVAIMIGLGILSTTGHSEPLPTTMNADILIQASATQITVTHVSLEAKVDFESFTRHLEASLGRFDPTSLKALLQTDPASADARLAQMEGDQGLMIFSMQNHGVLLNLAGTRRHAMRYNIGNPRVALRMTRHDIRAGLYAPLSVLVYEEAPRVVRVEYDQPSTLFGQFGDADVTAVGRELDIKLAKVVEHAAQLAARP